MSRNKFKPVSKLAEAPLGNYYVCVEDRVGEIHCYTCKYNMHYYHILNHLKHKFGIDPIVITCRMKREWTF